MKLFMDDLLEKSSDRSRSLLFGLLQSCLLEGNALENCPLAHLRSTLSLEEKYHYAMESSDEEVHKILEQHDECFKKRIIASVKNNSI